MEEKGFDWTIRPSGSTWTWTIRARGEDAPVLCGDAPTRAVAAALVIRGLAAELTPRADRVGMAA